MQFDDRRERPLALRDEQPRHEAPVAVAEVFDVTRGEFVGLGWHGVLLLLGLLC